jgi:glycerophosphoryl diester phosphodiesterase
MALEEKFRGTTMLIMSHRGYHFNRPENTLEAFEQAVEIGVDGIETDVRLSADGLPILFHDRIAPNGREVAYLTLGELSELVGYSVPTLDRALERLDDVLWNIEVKTPSAVDVTLSLVNQYYRSRRLMITSFWHNIVEQFSHFPGVECGLLIAHHPLSDFSLLDLLPDSSRVRTIVWDYEVLDPVVLRADGPSDIRHFVYGAESEEEHRRCRDMEVAGIITDHPEFLIKELR